MFLLIETRQSLDKNNRWSHSHLLTHTNHVSMYYRMVRQPVHNFSRYRWDDDVLMLVASFLCGKFHLF